MNFQFFSAGEILFGAGQITKVGGYASQMGRRAFLITGGTSARLSGNLTWVAGLLREAGVEVVEYGGIDQEPTPEMVDQGTAAALAEGCDLVVGLGGGSVLDAAKAIAGLATNGGGARDYLEGLGHRNITKAPLPLIACPTTAGTGSEVTKNAVLTSIDERFKRSMRSPLLIPRLALVDSRLAHSLPPAQTAASGMDALVQLIEASVSRKATPLSRCLALAGIPYAARALPLAYREPDNIVAREEMALASLMSGLALANGGLGAAHGIGAALGALHGVPHGVACAMVIAPVIEMNMACALEIYAHVGRAITGRPELNDAHGAAACLQRIHQLLDELSIPPSLGMFGITEEDHHAIARASQGSSMAGNPVDLSEETIMQILGVVG